ncbi:Holliday junction ATP-dependent DNA helicase RuvB [Mesoplasma sp. JKS002658]|uniref:Holliday junction branch migration DNA helicase RuvB n=1 Tax=Mesoplasma whartonense TaxID=2878854 RepID=UPI002022A2F7|nr:MULTISPECIES: Holliday junction branch migration DNA helicase RuvB [unclassified Mesoplasma]MCL8211195.1 Holliday junction ATP-dependent DNA helicase RuvB [Mesoplasma sp. JKS002664]MCL8211856.1 Holliday junction ATP-dependent DNA helicase RuvB [Mesoplasma sp. JKS002662]MCL8212912.1 Holliday junction ATP-dependent DNA helicase RuvB [Mesoplasma sp. JKS002661]MCL8213162.1 Holliday junction ATP-dependent DNA helicase RuvB [Mesoplasma sp. JKS002660]MCL8214039.1 Holliday junction ATP-dependent DN
MNQDSDVWAEYQGQNRIITNLKMYVQSAMILEKPLDHTLIYGQSGMGKTTLAKLIAKVMKVKIHILNGTSLQKPSDIISVLTTLKPNEIIFIDEVHAISTQVSEILYPVIDEGKISLIIGQEYNSKNIQITLPPFTLITATTELDQLASPFLNRFPIYLCLDDYGCEEIGTIIAGYAQTINLPLNLMMATYLGGYARKTPRIALNLTKRINDFYLTGKIKNLNNQENLKQILHQMGLYEQGLTSDDLKYLQVLTSSSPLGLENIMQRLNIPWKIIKSMIEPYLIGEGYVIRTNKGRMITAKGEAFIKKVE